MAQTTHHPAAFPPAHDRQPSDASSSTSTAAPTPLALPHCGSLQTMGVPWSPVSFQDGVTHVDDDDDEQFDDEEDDDYDQENNNTNDGHQDDEELGEYVCYGDRLCLLCDGQVLALTRKFNLSYEQMALLAAATVLSGGLMGVASFFIWQKGLFRKRYAALLSDLVYKDSQTPSQDDLLRKLEAMVEVDARSMNSSAYESQITTTTIAGAHSSGGVAMDTGMRTRTTTGAGVDGHENDEPRSGGGGGGSESSSTRRKKAKAVTFRIFQYDPETKCIQYSSLGQPVQLDMPIIVAHAASRRAIRYKSHRGAVTISRPPRNLHFRRAVKESVAEIDASLEAFAQQQQQMRLLRRSQRESSTKHGRRRSDRHSSSSTTASASVKARPVSLTTAIFKKVMGGGGRRNTPPPAPLSLPLAQQQQNNQSTEERSPSRSRSAAHDRHGSGDDDRLSSLRNKGPHSQSLQLRPSMWSEPTMIAPSSPSRASRSSAARLRRRASQPPLYYHPTSNSHPAATTTTDAMQPKSLYRSISESCLTFVRNWTDSLQLQKQRRILQKKRKLLLKDLPNMAFPGRDGIYYVARIQQPIVPVFRNASKSGPVNTTTVTSVTQPYQRNEDDGDGTQPPYLRWGAPMQIVAAYNNSPCGFHSREYYRDPQQYMSTERTTCSPATIIPIPENGNLQAIAKESIRRVAHLEKRQVRLKIGTYNVWMMPRKISTFVDVSPKKNTRAKLIAESLPPCDVWVFTECFDHRARSVLLDKLKSSGGYYFNSPTVGHKSRGPENKYLDKLLNGGVILASKYPILSVRIKLFRDVSAGSDRFADKGVLYCKILKDGLLVHIFSTHLQAWNDPLSRSARRQQLTIIAEFMKSMGIDETVDCVVFVGDLNVNMWLNKQNGEYDEMLEILDASDSSLQLSTFKQSETQTTECKITEFKRRFMYSFDGRLNPLAGNGMSSDGSLELLDYVLVSRSHRQPSHASSYVQPIFATTPWMWKKQPQFHLSDHFPLISDLTFDMWRE